MSSDLVKHLREGDEFTFDPTQSKVSIGPINDPIYIGEEKPFGASVAQDIEAQLADHIEWVRRLADDLIASEAKLSKSEALLAKAVEALEEIVVDDTWGLDHVAYMKCRKALKATKGQDDE